MNQIQKCIWLIEAIRGGEITHKELSARWSRDRNLSDGKELSRSTFNRWRDIRRDHLVTFMEAMKRISAVEIGYKSFISSDIITFTIEPYCVKLYDNRWYVLGRNDKLRIYALDRMHAVRITERTFKLPKDFSAANISAIISESTRLLRMRNHNRFCCAHTMITASTLKRCRSTGRRRR